MAISRFLDNIHEKIWLGFISMAFLRCERTITILAPLFQPKMEFLYTFCRMTHLGSSLSSVCQRSFWAAFSDMCLFSSALVSAHVSQLQSNIDFYGQGEYLYSCIHFFQMLVSLFSAGFDRHFRYSMSSLFPNKEPIFFDVFHSSFSFLIVVVVFSFFIYIHFQVVSFQNLFYIIDIGMFLSNKVHDVDIYYFNWQFW